MDSESLLLFKELPVEISQYKYQESKKKGWLVY